MMLDEPGRDVRVHHGLVVLTDEQVGELRAVVNSRDVPAVVATRARIVFGRPKAGCAKTSVRWPGCRCLLWTVGSTGTSGSGWPAWRNVNAAAGGSRSRLRCGPGFWR